MGRRARTTCVAILTTTIADEVSFYQRRYQSTMHCIKVEHCFTLKSSTKSSFGRTCAADRCAFEGFRGRLMCPPVAGVNHSTQPDRRLTYDVAFSWLPRSSCCVEEYTFCQPRDFLDGPRCCSGAIGDSSTSNVCSEGDTIQRRSIRQDGHRRA